MDPITQAALHGAIHGVQHGIILSLALMTIAFTIPALAGATGLAATGAQALIIPTARPTAAVRARAYTKVTLALALVAATSSTGLYLALGAWTP